MTADEQPDRALEEATDWLLKVQLSPDDSAVRADFDAWLASDPAHAGAWDRARRAWNIVAEVPRVHFTERAGARARIRWPFRLGSKTASRARRSFIARHRRGFAGTVVAACVAFAFTPPVSLLLRADDITSTAEVRDVRMADGTQVTLGPRSAIHFDYRADRREVTLLAGEAWFEVAHDPARPFRVRAGGVDARDIGTAFEVRVDRSTTTVNVARGLVGVQASAAGEGTEAQLGAGERIIVHPETGQMERGRIAADEVALWRSGRLFANNATVADVVERLRAYQSGWIVITDAQIARRRVTGFYDLRDPEAALQALVEAGGGRVRRITPLLYLLSGS